MPAEGANILNMRLLNASSVRLWAQTRSLKCSRFSTSVQSLQAGDASLLFKDQVIIERLQPGLAKTKQDLNEESCKQGTMSSGTKHSVGTKSREWTAEVFQDSNTSDISLYLPLWSLNVHYSSFPVNIHKRWNMWVFIWCSQSNSWCFHCFSDRYEFEEGANMSGETHTPKFPLEARW